MKEEGILEERGKAQQRFASIMEKVRTTGLLALALTFVIYLSGIVKPAVPMDQLPRYWGLPSGEYLASVNRDFLHLARPPAGWDWLAVADRSDFINFFGIALLAFTVVACYVGILPVLYRQNRPIYTILATLEVMVLVLAASGILVVSH